MVSSVNRENVLGVFAKTLSKRFFDQLEFVNNKERISNCEVLGWVSYTHPRGYRDYAWIVTVLTPGKGLVLARVEYDQLLAKHPNPKSIARQGKYLEGLRQDTYDQIFLK